MFKIKNIWKHGKSTLIGVFIVLALTAMIFFKFAEAETVMPLYLLVVPFLLYGRSGGPTSGGAGAVAVALLAMMVVSCKTPQERLNKLMAKHPNLIKYDTVRIRDTLYTKHISADTSFIFRTNKDSTWIIKRDRLIIRYQQIRDTIKIRGECLPEPIVIDTSAIVAKYANQVSAEPESVTKLKILNSITRKLFYIIGVVAIVIIILKLIKIIG